MRRQPDISDRAKQADAVLASRYDTLNELFGECEKMLRDLRPPYEVWISYVQGRGEPKHMLGMAKHDGKWRLCHDVSKEDGDPRDMFPPPKPIVECSAEIRLAATRFIRKLYAEIVVAKEGHTLVADAAISSLKDFLADRGALPATDVQNGQVS